jgi:AcrR family transcriptional regulator
MNTRQHILEAIERVIQSRGLARATTKEIAREAGCAEGTLYKHFHDKEDMFLAVIQEHLPDFVLKLSEENAGKRSLNASLQEIALAAIRYYEQLIPLAVSLFADSELIERHRKWMQEQNTGPQRIYERITAYIKAEQRQGRIADSLDAFSAASLLLGPCFQYAFLRYFTGAEPFPLTDAQFVVDTVTTLMNGLEQS